MILHITTEDAWLSAREAGFYESSSLQHQGFIHCCLPYQLPGVVERYYATAQNLFILYIDENRLLSPVQYEPSPVVADLFPHVYGIINLDAVQTTKPLVR